MSQEGELVTPRSSEAWIKTRSEESVKKKERGVLKNVQALKKFVKQRGELGKSRMAGDNSQGREPIAIFEYSRRERNPARTDKESFGFKG